MGEPKLMELIFHELAHVIARSIRGARHERSTIEGGDGRLSGLGAKHRAGSRLDLVVATGRRRNSDLRSDHGRIELQLLLCGAGNLLIRTRGGAIDPPLAGHTPLRRNLSRREHRPCNQCRPVVDGSAILGRNRDVRQTQRARPSDGALHVRNGPRTTCGIDAQIHAKRFCARRNMSD